MTLDEKEIINLYLNDKLSTYKIAELYDTKFYKINYILKKNNIPIRSNKINSIKYEYDIDFFKTIDTEEKAYWLGFIYADGNISKRGTYIFKLDLAITDYNHLVKFYKSIKCNKEVKVYKQKTGYAEGNSYCRASVSNNTFCEHLIDKGVIMNKTLILSPPTLKKELIRHFIRGYFDGDGCITSYIVKKKTVDYRTYKFSVIGTLEILDYIKSFIESETNIKINKYYKRRETDKVHHIEVGGNTQVKKILNLLYKNSNIYLDRKYDVYQENVVPCSSDTVNGNSVNCDSQVY